MATVGSMRPLGGVALKKTDTEIEHNVCIRKRDALLLKKTTIHTPLYSRIKCIRQNSI